MLLPINIGGQIFLLPINNNREKKNNDCEKMTIGEAILTFFLTAIVIAVIVFALVLLFECILTHTL